MVFNSIKLIAAERNLSEANDDPCVFAMARCLPDVIPQTRSINLISSWISELHPFLPRGKLVKNTAFDRMTEQGG